MSLIETNSFPFCCLSKVNIPQISHLKYFLVNFLKWKKKKIQTTNFGILSPYWNYWLLYMGLFFFQIVSPYWFEPIQSGLAMTLSFVLESNCCVLFITNWWFERKFLSVFVKDSYNLRFSFIVYCCICIDNLFVEMYK